MITPHEDHLYACPHWAPGRITMRRGCTACAAGVGQIIEMTTRADRAPSAPDTKETTMKDRAERMTRTNGEELLEQAANTWAGETTTDHAYEALERYAPPAGIPADTFGEEAGLLHRAASDELGPLTEWINGLTLDEARSLITRTAEIAREHRERATQAESLATTIRTALNDTARTGTSDDLDDLLDVLDDSDTP